MELVMTLIYYMKTTLLLQQEFQIILTWNVVVKCATSWWLNVL